MKAEDKTIKIMVWDNGGKTPDRYSVAIQGIQEVEGLPYTILLGADEMPFHPQGIGYHGGEVKTSEFNKDRRFTRHRNIGKRIKFTELPPAVQKFVAMELMPEE